MRACRICHSDNEDSEPLRSPCACAGSIQFAHATCLREWILSQGQRLDNARCEVCHAFIRFEQVYRPGMSAARMHAVSGEFSTLGWILKTTKASTLRFLINSLVAGAWALTPLLAGLGFRLIFEANLAELYVLGLFWTVQCVGLPFAFRESLQRAVGREEFEHERRDVFQARAYFVDMIYSHLERRSTVSHALIRANQVASDAADDSDANFRAEDYPGVDFRAEADDSDSDYVPDEQEDEEDEFWATMNDEIDNEFEGDGFAIQWDLFPRLVLELAKVEVSLDTILGRNGMPALLRLLVWHVLCLQVAFVSFILVPYWVGLRLLGQVDSESHVVLQTLSVLRRGIMVTWGAVCALNFLVSPRRVLPFLRGVRDSMRSHSEVDKLLRESARRGHVPLRLFTLRWLLGELSHHWYHVSKTLTKLLLRRVGSSLLVGLFALWCLDPVLFVDTSEAWSARMQTQFESEFPAMLQRCLLVGIVANSFARAVLVALRETLVWHVPTEHLGEGWNREALSHTVHTPVPRQALSLCCDLALSLLCCLVLLRVPLDALELPVLLPLFAIPRRSLDSAIAFVYPFSHDNVFSPLTSVTKTVIEKTAHFFDIADFVLLDPQTQQTSEYVTHYRARIVAFVLTCWSALACLLWGVAYLVLQKAAVGTESRQRFVVSAISAVSLLLLLPQARRVPWRLMLISLASFVAMLVLSACVGVLIYDSVVLPLLVLGKLLLEDKAEWLSTLVQHSLWAHSPLTWTRSAAVLWLGSSFTMVYLFVFNGSPFSVIRTVLVMRFVPSLLTAGVSAALAHLQAVSPALQLSHTMLWLTSPHGQHCLRLVMPGLLLLAHVAFYSWRHMRRQAREAHRRALENRFLQGLRLVDRDPVD